MAGERPRDPAGIASSSIAATAKRRMRLAAAFTAILTLLIGGLLACVSYGPFAAARGQAGGIPPIIMLALIISVAEVASTFVYVLLANAIDQRTETGNAP